MLPARAKELIAAKPATPIDAPRTRRSFPVEEVWEESARYLAFRVGVDDDYRDAYTTPGQYVTLSPQQFEPKFLVISNAPSESPGEWEFLVDRHTQLGASMDPLSSGTALELSLPEGPGYPTGRVAGHHVHCFVTGSGIASIRPAVQFWRDHPDEAPSRVAIYYGESRISDFAYRDEVEAWTRNGIDVFQCASDESESSETFTYVQDAYDARAPDLTDAVVFIAGAEVMKRGVLHRLLDEGFPLDRIVTNV